MAVVDYLTIEEEIVSESRVGVLADYVPDPLGDNAKMLNSLMAVTDTFTYWPYGEVRNHVGLSATPFTYCGTLQYRSAQSRVYVRNRVITPEQTNWLTVDPQWPAERAYTFVDGNPSTLTDPDGTSACIQKHTVLHTIPPCTPKEKRDCRKKCKPARWICIKFKSDVAARCFCIDLGRITSTVACFVCQTLCPYDPDTCGILCSVVCKTN